MALSPGRQAPTRRRPSVLQIGTADEGGGAATVARGLSRGYRERGHEVWDVVGQRHSPDPSVFALVDDRRPPYKFSGYSSVQGVLKSLSSRYPNRGWGLVSRALRAATHPGVLADYFLGREDFRYPATYDIFNLVGAVPDLVHCHNLHGHYFDLRALAWISARVPTVLTLHDMWLLTGHCAYSLDCERWRTGCGECPDLTLYPAVRADATALNWQRKRTIYAQSRLSVAAPSRWLLERVERSMLGPMVADARVIPNGVDLGAFRPGHRPSLRTTLGLPQDAFVVLLTVGSPGTTWKDDDVLKSMVEEIERSPQAPRPILLLSIGRDIAAPRRGRVAVRSVKYQAAGPNMAAYYAAADVYVHATRADNFPLAVLEAMACGTPVVATNVGGIPEQLRPVVPGTIQAGSGLAIDGATGVLVPAGDASGLAEAVLALLTHDESRRTLGDNAACDARTRFDVNTQVDAYLDWYRTVTEQWRMARES